MPPRSFGNVYQVTGKHVDPITGQPDLGLEAGGGIEMYISKHEHTHI